MGIFNKIKKIDDSPRQVLAKLEVSPENDMNNGNEAFRFHVTCKIKDADLDLKKAYLKVLALEKVVIQNVHLTRKTEGESEIQRENIKGSHQTFCKEYIILEHQLLKAKQTYSWDVEVVLPREVNGTYHGFNAEHKWKAYAGMILEEEGATSDWITFDVSK